MWAHFITERTNAARLRSAFEAALALHWPGATWAAGEEPETLIGPLDIQVAFDGDEITTYASDCHWHRGVYGALTETALAAEEQSVATDVVLWIKARVDQGRR